MFNHPEWIGFPGGGNCGGIRPPLTCAGSSAPYSAGDPVACLGPASANNATFGEVNYAHLARILQFGLKFLF